MHWAIIEDNEFDQDILDLSFNEISEELDSKFQYTFYTHAKDFFKSIKTKKYQLVLCDMNLIDKTGLEVLRELKSISQYKNTPFLIFSTSLQESEIEEAYKLGADNYILKPSGFKSSCETLLKIYKTYEK